ncbi:MAG: YfaP family protein [Acetobacteraceae bacterium]|nr:YfaP family protein [Acetobacteraceae bacterium]
MAPLRLIGETDRRSRRPAPVLDGVAQDYRAQVVQHLASRGMAREAGLFAEGNVLPETIQWFTALDGPIARLDDLPAERRAAVLDDVRALVEAVEQEAARLRADRAEASRVLGDLLATALEGAALADLRLVGGAPVLAGWGLRAVENAAPLPALKGELVRAAAVPRAVPPPAPELVPPDAVPVAEVPVPVVAEPATRWPLRLLGLSALVLLLAAVLAWFLPDLMRHAVALVRLPAAPVCELPPAPDGGLVALQEEEIRLRGRIAELERTYAGRVQQCRIAAIPRPVPQVAPPIAPPQRRSEIDQRLEREQAKSGEYQVSLIWDGPADLDLHVRCPGGGHIYFERTHGCGAVLDVDMNAQGGRGSRTPVENVVWSGVPPSGSYRVQVHYYDFDERRTPVPFTVRIVTAGQSREVKGVANSAGMQNVAEFTVP